MFRNTNYQFFYDFYISHQKYPPITFCSKIQNLLLSQSNPNKFDFYMTPEKRQMYELPFLFTHISYIDRKGSALSKTSSNK